MIINDQDAQAAWSFTLLHELTHVWLGETGVSGAFAEATIEQFCNRVASEFLLPSGELTDLQVDTTDFETTQARITNFAKDRHLSQQIYGRLQALPDGKDREGGLEPA